MMVLNTGGHIMTKTKRAALYVRVSTDRQTVENQIAALTKVAEARGWQIVETFSDVGISGAKTREDRPGLDDLLKRAQRREFDVVMAWAIDRIGRSLIDLLNTIETLKAVGVDLYLDQQAIDTTTPAGKLMLQMTGAFAEFERNMIQARIHAGLKRAVAAGRALRARQYRSPDGRKPDRGISAGKTLGRPLNDPDAVEKAKRALRKGVGINKVAKLVGLSNGTVQRLKAELTGRPFVGVAA
jgi:DNA invertase Pin-like site-specific DNA recombinase